VEEVCSEVEERSIPQEEHLQVHGRPIEEKSHVEVEVIQKVEHRAIEHQNCSFTQL